MMHAKMLGMAAVVASGLVIAAEAQAAPGFDAALSAASAAEVMPVQYYGYGYAPRPYYGYRPRPYYGYGYGESPQHYAYRQAHRAYRAERYYRYGY